MESVLLGQVYSWRVYCLVRYLHRECIALSSVLRVYQMVRCVHWKYSFVYLTSVNVRYQSKVKPRSWMTSDKAQDNNNNNNSNSNNNNGSLNQNNMAAQELNICYLQ